MVMRGSKKNTTKPREAGDEYNGKTPLPDPKQEFFCVLFTTNTLPGFWGNGQNSYEFAYGHNERIEKIEDEIDALMRLIVGPKSKRKGKSMAQLKREIDEKKLQIAKIHKVCRASAPRLLAQVSIKLRCGHLLDNLATHTIVDRELVYVIQQRENMDVKMRAIEHHDKREQRIRDKVDLVHQFETIESFTYVKPAPAVPLKKK